MIFSSFPLTLSMDMRSLRYSMVVGMVNFLVN